MDSRILVVAPDFPYPPNHGGRVDVWKRILALKDLGYKIDLLVTIKEPPSKEDIDIVKNTVDNIIIVNRHKMTKGLFSLRPHQVENRSAFISAKLPNSYDYALLEGSPCEAALRNPSLKAKHIILRVHNDEALYFKKLGDSTKSKLKSLYYYLESIKFKISDKKLYKKIKHFLFISRDEYAKFHKEQPQKHAIFLPPVVALSTDSKPRIREGKRVLFVGSFFMPNNRDGLEWYIENVHPHLRKIEGYKFVVAGNSKGMSLDWLTNGSYGDDIEVHDSPPSLDNLYDNAVIFINPMRFGAGMKIKTVEALCHGLPMVSTTIGLEGTGLEDGKHLYQADDSELFAKRVAEILEDPEKGRGLVSNAIDYIEKEFNAPKKLEEFLSEIS